MAPSSGKLAGALQENILALLCFSEKDCSLIRSSVELRLWSNPIFREIASQAYDFIDQHGAPPRDHIADLLEDHLKDKTDGPLYKDILHSLNYLRDNINTRYVSDRLQRFVRENTLRLGIIEAAEALQKEDLAHAESAIETALRKQAPSLDLGITLGEAADQLGTEEEERQCIDLHIPELDKHELGPARGELWLLIGGPKRGKTFGMLHVAKRAILQQQKVLYVTLEVSERIIARRAMQSIMSFTKKEGEDVSFVELLFKDEARTEFDGIREHSVFRRGLHDPATKTAPSAARSVQLRIAQLRLKDRLRIKAFPTGTLTVRELETYLDQLERKENFVPDVVIVDYADLMSIDLDQYRLSVGNVYKDLRGLGVRRNCRMVTASQLNRSGVSNRTATETAVAEDFSKIAIADTVVIINQTSVERALGLARLYVAVARNDADRFTILITQNFKVGQFAIDSERLRRGYFSWLGKREQAEREDKEVQEDTPDEAPNGEAAARPKQASFSPERSEPRRNRPVPGKGVRRSQLPERRAAH